MNGAQNITVTFPYSYKAKVSSSNQGYEPLVQAYGNAGSVDTLYGRAVIFTEDFTLGDSKVVKFFGGRDAWYEPQDAWTSLLGNLTIQRGSLATERLMIK